MSHDSHQELAIHPLNTVEGTTLLQRQQLARRTRLLTAGVVILLLLGGARTIFSRMANAQTLQAQVNERAAQPVKAYEVIPTKTAQTLTLPGSLQGFIQSPVAARAGGYLRAWHKDIGSRVGKGELLAEIDTPELDQQLAQAIAAQQQTASSVELARSTQERWEALRKRDAVSQQELDERRSAFAQAQSNLAAAKANVDRLRELSSFKHVVAPFAGVITRRNVDVGDLIDGSGRPLFLLSQTDALRVYVNVPQAYAQLVRKGQPATVTQDELMGQSFKGEIARTAAAIDAGTRTMQVEITLPNKEGTLMPGAFVQVALRLPPSATLSVPGNTLLFRPQGTRVALIDNQGLVQLKAVRLGRNLGDRVEVLEGLAGGEKIVLNPPDSMAEGDKVQIVADKPTSTAAKAKS